MSSLKVVDAVCDFIVAEADLCEKILNWTTAGISPTSICAEIGLCTGSSCACGYCTEYSTSRCLGINAKCPNDGAFERSAAVVAAQSASVVASVAASVAGAASAAAPICLTGHCDAAHYGCCLTCW